MFTEYPDGSISCSACVRAIDLIRIADRMMKENMKFAQVKVIFDESSQDYDGLVKLSAIPAPGSNDVTVYPVIKGLLTVEIDDDEY